ncbi:ABC transporter permease [Terrimonas ferruginea]|uniref:ABC transporter permease n=1 Tax=Terrimonas ferruginea TaxID=249 RepID=UPI000426A106|nr:ABC transporter permease [Terrimonas ferruginea]
MIRRSFEIVASSLRMALQELWKNKLRTFLSLFGITIGIFCIIGVLATVNSLQQNIQNEINSLGSNTIYVDKWDYTAGGGPDYPWWKFVNRPVPKYGEIQQIKNRTSYAKYVAFRIQVTDNVEYRGTLLNNINIYGVSDDFENIQPLEIPWGRYLSDPEFNYGSAVVVLGHDVAEKLLGATDYAVGREVTIRGKKLLVAGVIKKQGKQMIGGWDFDQSVIIPYRFARNIMNELKADPVILVQGKDNVPSRALKDELTGAMRAIHKLSPTQEADFALNDINDLSQSVSEAFVGLNIGGAIIGGISLIVGLFGVANIMFVTVRERTSQIGLKKAIGAKKGIILTEFLLESAFLCIIGGLIGLTLVFVLAQILSRALDFPVFISVDNMIWTFVICVTVGIVAGIIPASQAARMDPVVAIRSK